MNILKGLLEILLNCLIENCQKFCIFLINKPCLEMNEIDNVINKTCSPNQYFNKKTNFYLQKSLFWCNSDFVCYSLLLLYQKNSFNRSSGWFLQLCNFSAFFYREFRRKLFLMVAQPCMHEFSVHSNDSYAKTDKSFFLFFLSRLRLLHREELI